MKVEGVPILRLFLKQDDDYVDYLGERSSEKITEFLKEKTHVNLG